MWLVAVRIGERKYRYVKPFGDGTTVLSKAKVMGLDEALSVSRRWRGYGWSAFLVSTWMAEKFDGL